MADGNGSEGNGRHRDDDVVRQRFNDASDAIVAAVADGREHDVQRLMTEFFTLQEKYLRGVVGKRLHDRLRVNDGVEDVVMFVAAQLIDSLRRGRKVHWHMLFSIYVKSMVTYDRKFGRLVDRPGTPDGGVSALTAAHRVVHGDSDATDPVEQGEHESLLARLREMLHELADGPGGIRHPDRMIAVLNYHLAGWDNNAEIAAKIGVPDGTLRREWNEFRTWAMEHFPDLRDFLPITGEPVRDPVPTGASTARSEQS